MARMNRDAFRGVVSSRRAFLRATAVAGGWAMVPGALRAAEGDVGVPATRLARLATGANVCRWFRFPRNETAEHLGNYVPDAEAEMMARMGLFSRGGPPRPVTLTA